MNNLKFINIGFDEEGYYLMDEGKLCEYKWKGYLSSNGMCGKEEGYKENIEGFKVGGVNKDWFEENEENENGIEEWKKFEVGYKKFEELKEKFGGVVYNWCVEYDNNWILIYDEENKDVEKLVGEWMEREVDESEFEEEVEG